MPVLIRGPAKSHKGCSLRFAVRELQAASEMDSMPDFDLQAISLEQISLMFLPGNRIPAIPIARSTLAATILTFTEADPLRILIDASTISGLSFVFDSLFKKLAPRSLYYSFGTFVKNV